MIIGSEYQTNTLISGINPIIYTLNGITRKRDGNIILTLQEESRVRNPKYPQKTKFNLKMDDAVIIAKVTAKDEEILGGKDGRVQAIYHRADTRA